MNKLHQYLNKCSREYYSGQPSISDEVFDALAVSAGYNSVGAKQHTHIEKHLYPMYSLQKFYEDEGKQTPLQGYVLDRSPKLDGAALSLLYIDGVFTRALTRGDGIEGTIVTDKFLDSKFIPQEIPLPGIVQITGEIAAPKYIENARNYAAGSLNLKDASEFKTRAVTFFAYGVENDNPGGTFSSNMQTLSGIGFNTVKDPDIHNIYPCDGIVFRINDTKEFLSLGYTSKHPRGAYALKERGVAVETTLLSVEWQVGKSGKVTPVAILSPVMVGDAMVSRATLNNIAFIRALDLHIGDTVGIVRAGEIIPQVTHKIE